MAGRPKLDVTYPRVVACTDCGYDTRINHSNQTHRCKHCKGAQNRVNEMLKRRKIGRPMQKDPMYFERPQRCADCPSRTIHGRCGRITSGDKQWLPAQVVRINGDCPRGIFSDVDRAKRIAKKISRLALSSLAN